MWKRISGIIFLLVFVVFVSGCTEEVMDDSRFIIDPVAAKEAMNEGFGVPDGTEEVDLVENMAANRNNYRNSLRKLMEYYKVSGDALKHRWARRELGMFLNMPQYRYLMPGEAAYANLRATDAIEEADNLFAEAMALYKDARNLVVVTDETKLRDSLNKFNLIISNYPNSDKIDDAAFWAGRIYEHFKDYEIAVVYYQRAYQWDEETPYPARYRAAYIMDYHLRMREDAVVLYQLSYEKESQFESKMAFVKSRLLQLNSRGSEQDDYREIEADISK